METSKEFQIARDEAFPILEPDTAGGFNNTFQDLMDRQMIARKGADWAYEWLIEKNKLWSDDNLRLISEKLKLEQKLAIAVEALEYYTGLYTSDGSWRIWQGKDAQQALAKIRGNTD